MFEVIGIRVITYNQNYFDPCLSKKMLLPDTANKVQKLSRGKT